MADVTPSVQVVSGGAGPSTSQQTASGMGYRQCLLVATAALLTEVGFDSASKMCLESLAEMLQSFIVELGRSSRQELGVFSNINDVFKVIVGC